MRDSIQRIFDWLFDTKHPLRAAIFCLVVALGNAYEAVYIRPSSFMSIVDWIFVVGGFLGFVVLILEAITDSLLKSKWK